MGTHTTKKNCSLVVYYAVRFLSHSKYVVEGNTPPHTENIKGLNLAAFIYTTVQVSRLLQDV
jgi:hypothetical protein